MIWRIWDRGLKVFLGGDRQPGRAGPVWVWVWGSGLSRELRSRTSDPKVQLRDLRSLPWNQGCVVPTGSSSGSRGARSAGEPGSPRFCGFCADPPEGSRFLVTSAEVKPQPSCLISVSFADLHLQNHPELRQAFLQRPVDVSGPPRIKPHQNHSGGSGGPVLFQEQLLLSEQEDLDPSSMNRPADG